MHFYIWSVCQSTMIWDKVTFKDVLLNWVLTLIFQLQSTLLSENTIVVVSSSIGSTVVVSSFGASFESSELWLLVSLLTIKCCLIGSGWLSTNSLKRLLLKDSTGSSSCKIRGSMSWSFSLFIREGLYRNSSFWDHVLLGSY